MNKELTLKAILLEKLNRILNPNFETKFIWAVFILGVGLINYQRVVSFLSTVEIISDNIAIKASLSSGTDTALSVMGGILVLVSCFLFYLKFQAPEEKIKKYKNLNSAAPDILKILDENRRIFINFGPNSSAGNTAELQEDVTMWEHLKRETIVPNNTKIKIALNRVKSFKKEELQHVEAMKNHIEAFEKHCEDPKFDYSAHQFPKGFSDLIYKYALQQKVTPKTTNYEEWLRDNLSEANLNIEKLFLFGSVLYSKPTNDLDILVKTEETKIEAIKEQAMIFQDIAEQFQKAFSIKLHITAFSEAEKDSYSNFLKKIPAYMEVKI